MLQSKKRENVITKKLNNNKFLFSPACVSFRFFHIENLFSINYVTAESAGVGVLLYAASP